MSSSFHPIDVVHYCIVNLNLNRSKTISHDAIHIPISLAYWIVTKLRHWPSTSPGALNKCEVSNGRNSWPFSFIHRLWSNHLLSYIAGHSIIVHTHPLRLKFPRSSSLPWYHVIASHQNSEYCCQKPGWRTTWHNAVAVHLERSLGQSAPKWSVLLTRHDPFTHSCWSWSSPSSNHKSWNRTRI